MRADGQDDLLPERGALRLSPAVVTTPLGTETRARPVRKSNRTRSDDVGVDGPVQLSAVDGDIRQ
jgi:hypothetical protein